MTLKQFIMAELQDFMFIFRYEPVENYQPTPEELAQEEKDWCIFIGSIANQAKLVSVHQLGFEGVQVLPDQSEKQGMYISDKETVGGIMVVKATNIEEATMLSKLCPIFKKGGTVEVRSMIPM